MCVFFLFSFCRRNVETFRNVFRLFFVIFFDSLCHENCRCFWMFFANKSHEHKQYNDSSFYGTFHSYGTLNWHVICLNLFGIWRQTMPGKINQRSVAIGIKMNGSMATILMRWQTFRFIFVSKWFFWSLDVWDDSIRFDSMTDIMKTLKFNQAKQQNNNVFLT